MPLFTGVPYITETPAEAMRAERPAVRLFANAYQQSLDREQKQKQFETTRRQRQEESWLARDQLGFEREKFRTESAIKAEEMRMKRDEASRLIEAHKLDQQAAMVRQEVLHTEMDLALKKAQFELDKMARDARDAPKIADWQQQLAKATTTDQLMSVPFPSLEDPDNIKRITDTFTQYRMVFQNREMQKSYLDTIWAKNDAKKNYADYINQLPPAVRDRFIQDMDTWEAMAKSMIYTPAELDRERRRINNLYGTPGSSMVRPPNYLPQGQQGPVPQPGAGVTPPPAAGPMPQGTNAPTEMNFMGLDEQAVRDFFRNK